MELFASKNPRYYSLYFDLKIWFRARNVTGAFEKRAPGLYVMYQQSFLEFGWGKGKKGLAPIVQKVDSEALIKGLRMSLVWILKPVVLRIEEEAISLLAFSHCICAFVCCCRSFNPSLCRLLPFLLSHVTFSSPCRLSQFYPKRASIVLSTF